MTVTRRREVVGRGAVAEVDVLDGSKVLQLVEIAVDGREVHVRGAAVDLGCQLLCRAVPVRFDE